jgi:hypothetical protein
VKSWLFLFLNAIVPVDVTLNSSKSESERFRFSGRELPNAQQFAAFASDVFQYPLLREPQAAGKHIVVEFSFLAVHNDSRLPFGDPVNFVS